MKKIEFKIGDKVKITGNTNCSQNNIGEIGVITEKSRTLSGNFRVKVGKNSDNGCWSKPTEIEHYQEEVVLDVVLEPEFVLPENWHVIVTKENQKILSQWREVTDNWLIPISHLVGINKSNSGLCKGHNPGDKIIDLSNPKYYYNFGREITFEQFKQYVLKEKPEIEPLPFFKILVFDITDETILRVQNNEGNIFQIGDYIRSTTGKIKEPETMIIKRFRHNNDKSNICAVTDRLSDYGIGIDKIEHVIDFKKNEVIVDVVESIIPENESNLDKAKRLYPIGTKYTPAGGVTKCNFEVTVQSFRSINADIIEGEDGKGYLYHNGEWANIISKPEVKEPLVITSSLKDMLILQYAGVKNVAPIQSEKEETLLEKAQRLFSIGTRFNCLYNSNKEWEIVELSRLWGDRETTIVARATPINAKIGRSILKTLYFPSRNWVNILYNGYKVGDTFTQYGSTIFTITKLETINGSEVAFFKHPNGYSGPQDRILTKNIKK